MNCYYLGGTVHDSVCVCVYILSFCFLFYFRHSAAKKQQVLFLVW